MTNHHRATLLLALVCASTAAVRVSGFVDTCPARSSRPTSRCVLRSSQYSESGRRVGTRFYEPTNRDVSIPSSSESSLVRDSTQAPFQDRTIEQRQGQQQDLMRVGGAPGSSPWESQRTVPWYKRQSSYSERPSQQTEWWERGTNPWQSMGTGTRSDDIGTSSSSTQRWRRRSDLMYDSSDAQARFDSPRTDGGYRAFRDQSTDSVVQGDSRRTWSSTHYDPSSLHSHRPHSPIYANVDYWSGPNDTPRKMKVFSMDGYERPVNARFTNPRGGSRGYSSSVDVRNEGPMEFPLSAQVRRVDDLVPRTSYGSGGPTVTASGPSSFTTRGVAQSKSVQGGGSNEVFQFDPRTRAVEVTLDTEGMPCYALVEVLCGPGEPRQTYEVYSDDGSPWQSIVDLPGYSAVIQVTNEGPLEFPIKCRAEAIE